MDSESAFVQLLYMARVAAWSEHRNVILFFRTIEDVFEVEPHCIVTEEIRCGEGLQKKWIQPAALAILVGQVVMEHTLKAGILHCEGILAARRRDQQRSKKGH